MSDFVFFHLIILISVLYTTLIVGFVYLVAEYFPKSAWKRVVSIIIYIYLLFLTLYFISDKLGGNFQEFSNVSEESVKLRVMQIEAGNDY